MPRMLVIMGIIATLEVAGCALTPVSVTGREGATSHGSQSETAFAVNRLASATIITVTYNDGTDQSAVQYTATTRKAQKGATHLGWSYSSDFGSSWTYGGRITPSDAWPILWGDPGITNSARDQRYVYLATLAVPKAKLDLAPGGVIDGPANNYIGGACIARSTDGGKTFALYQCLQTTESDPTGDFYDGGNMASDLRGNIYAGWVNTDRSAAHIWRASGESGVFEKLPNPFTDGSFSIVSHPRLRANLDTDELYVMAQNMSGELLIARWNGNTWSATWHTGMYPQSYPSLASTGGGGTTGDTVLRTGPQFSFDIGSFGKANDHIRMMFTRKSAVNNRLYVAGAACDIVALTCHYIPQWGTDEGDSRKASSSFNPLVRAYRSPEMTGSGEPSLWMGTHTTYSPATGRVTFSMGGLAILEVQNSPDLYLYFAIFTLPDRVLCADMRGYWGDYDDLNGLGPVAGRTSNVFVRTFTDSQQGCDYRWNYTSSKVHVGFTGN